MDPKSDGELEAGREAVVNLEHGFDGARQLVKEARLLLRGEAAEEGGDAAKTAEAVDAAQATREPSSDTVQKPASE